jgi:hypothetical protein
MDLDEQFRLKHIDFEEHKIEVIGQDKLIAELSAAIVALEKDTELLGKDLIEERKVNKIEDEKYRKLG